MNVTFWGAARTTTGSLHLLDVAGQRVALDCGMFQGRRSLAREYNSTFPCPPADIAAVVLSHAHIDHIGNLPTFTRQGGDQASVYCTPATADLARVMLLDSAHIQEKDTQFVNKLRRKKHEPPVDPLYTVEDAERTLEQLMTFGYYRDKPIVDGITAKYLEAGHILGSAVTQLDLTEGGKKRRLVFSGDVGRSSHPILRPPEVPSDADYLIMESTYGARVHEPAGDLRAKLLDIVKRVAERGGKLIIPAFSVGRTQEVVFHLNALFNDGSLPRLRVYVDSPLSNNVTRVFRNHPECFNRDVRDLMRTDADPFGFDCLTYIEKAEDSKALNDLTEPAIIISASGMCEAGRILHHLRNSVGDAKNCVLFVGYQAENTLGRRLVEKAEKVRIFGEEHTVRCEIKSISGLSGHADANELKDFAFRVKQRGERLKRIFLVHGELPAQETLAAYLTETLGVPVSIPSRGDVVELE